MLYSQIKKNREKYDLYIRELYYLYIYLPSSVETNLGIKQGEQTEVGVVRFAYLVGGRRFKAIKCGTEMRFVVATYVTGSKYYSFEASTCDIVVRVVRLTPRCA